VTEIKSSPAIKAVLSNGTTRTFCRTENIRPTQDGNFGAVRTMITETLTAVDGGIRVDSHAVGTVEGTHIDQRSSDFYLGVTMERAAAYRIRMGYHEVTPRETKRQLRVIRDSEALGLDEGTAVDMVAEYGDKMDLECSRLGITIAGVSKNHPDLSTFGSAARSESLRLDGEIKDCGDDY